MNKRLKEILKPASIKMIPQTFWRFDLAKVPTWQFNAWLNYEYAVTTLAIKNFGLDSQTTPGRQHAPLATARLHEQQNRGATSATSQRNIIDDAAAIVTGQYSLHAMRPAVNEPQSVNFRMKEY